MQAQNSKKNNYNQGMINRLGYIENKLAEYNNILYSGSYSMENISLRPALLFNKLRIL
jgi:hypothetical protein